MAGKLIGYSRQIAVSKSAVTFDIDGNISGDGEKDFYAAQVLIVGKMMERINYSPDKIIEHRWVYKPDGVGYLYVEHYTGGKLATRVWYKDVQTEQGTQSVIDRTETY
jgi:hypothetical protein